MATVAGFGLTPALGAFQGYARAEPDATRGERWGGAVVGAVKEADDSLVGGTAGTFATGLAAETGPAAPLVGAAVGVEGRNRRITVLKERVA